MLLSTAITWVKAHLALVAILIVFILGTPLLLTYILLQAQISSPYSETSNLDFGIPLPGNKTDSYEYALAPTPGITTRDVTNDETNTSSPSSQLIIKNASLSLEVDSVEEKNQTIQEITTALGGFVIKAQITSYTTYSDAKYGTITIRVPSDKFEEAITQMKAIAKKITSETIAGDDVTEEYTDLTAQLRNLEATENELRELFDRTGTVEEILQVQRELSNVRSQIEVKKGRIQYLEQSAALSSISITLTETDNAPIVNDEWDIVTIAKNAARDLISSLQNLAGSITYFVIFFGPYLLILGLSLFYVYRRFKKQ